MKLDSIGDYITLNGAAKKLGVSYRRIWLYVTKRNLPTVRVGKTILVRFADIQGIQRSQ